MDGIFELRAVRGLVAGASCQGIPGDGGDRLHLPASGSDLSVVVSRAASVQAITTVAAQD